MVSVLCSLKALNIGVLDGKMETREVRSQVDHGRKNLLFYFSQNLTRLAVHQFLYLLGIPSCVDPDPLAS